MLVRYPAWVVAAAGTAAVWGHSKHPAPSAAAPEPLYRVAVAQAIVMRNSECGITDARLSSIVYHLRPFVIPLSVFESPFDRFEYLLALIHADLREQEGLKPTPRADVYFSSRPARPTSKWVKANTPVRLHPVSQDERPCPRLANLVSASGF